MSVKILKEVLPNGLTLVGEPNPQAKSVSLGFFVKTGARDEQTHESGLSHFLEHMMFKGTAKRSAEQVNFDLGNIGAQANAYTSEENTVYYASVLPEFLPDLHEVLSDMLRPALDPKEFFMEQKVILEEIALYRDRPHFWFFQQLIADFYGQNTLGQPVLGTDESVSALTPEVMNNYFLRRYSPHNIICSCAGNFNWADFVELSRKNCSHWQGEQIAREYEAFPTTTMEKTYYRPKLNQAHLLMVSPGIAANDPLRYAAAVLGSVLGDHVGSRLYWTLIETGLAESASASNDENDRSGLFSIYAGCSPDSLPQIEKIIADELSKLASISEDEVQRAKTKLATRIVASGELPLGRMMGLGNAFLYRGTADSLDQIIANVQQVKLSDVLNLTKLLSADQMSTFRLLPEAA